MTAIDELFKIVQQQLLIVADQLQTLRQTAPDTALRFEAALARQLTWMATGMSADAPEEETGMTAVLQTLRCQWETVLEECDDGYADPLPYRQQCAAANQLLLSHRFDREHLDSLGCHATDMHHPAALQFLKKLTPGDPQSGGRTLTNGDYVKSYPETLRVTIYDGQTHEAKHTLAEEKNFLHGNYKWLAPHWLAGTTLYKSSSTPGSTGFFASSSQSTFKVWDLRTHTVTFMQDTMNAYEPLRDQRLLIQDKSCIAIHDLNRKETRVLMHTTDKPYLIGETAAGLVLQIRNTVYLFTAETSTAIPAINVNHEAHVAVKSNGDLLVMQQAAEGLQVTQYHYDSKKYGYAIDKITIIALSVKALHAVKWLEDNIIIINADNGLFACHLETAMAPIAILSRQRHSLDSLAVFYLENQVIKIITAEQEVEFFKLLDVKALFSNALTSRMEPVSAAPALR